MNFIKKNIKKILNKKNRKYLIAAIAIAAIAFYFLYKRKENFISITRTEAKEMLRQRRSDIEKIENKKERKKAIKKFEKDNKVAQKINKKAMKKTNRFCNNLMKPLIKQRERGKMGPYGLYMMAHNPRWESIMKACQPSTQATQETHEIINPSILELDESGNEAQEGTGSIMNLSEIDQAQQAAQGAPGPPPG
jgi:peptide deformylase